VSRHSVKGTGLGLTLVKHAVEAHGGHIDVISQPGQGATFSICLPLSKHEE
jgi:signal transduction histidine kinase